MASLDVSAYEGYFRQLDTQKLEARARATRAARAALPQVLAVLRDHGARRVWLIGSLARRRFEPGSDLDFMTEGLDEQQAARAQRVACERSGFWVDLLRAEALDPEWRNHHQRFGELLDGG